MQNVNEMDAGRSAELLELINLEVADIIATANDQGFSAKDVLSALSTAVAASISALAEDPDPADDPAAAPAGPHARAELVDREKTPGAGALPETRSGEVDPGVG